MTPGQCPEPLERVWHGALADPDQLSETAVRQGHALADAARDGNWRAVLTMLDTADFSWDVNTWRPGGSSCFTPLHQAAWHGAPTQVVDELVARGGWLTLRTADSRTPQEVAAARGHHALAERLEPRDARNVEPGCFDVLDRHLTALVDSRIRPNLQVQLRYPQTRVLSELSEDSLLWFPVPGMYGGFAIQLLRSYLFVESWSRVVGGSGQAHVVTPDGFTLVEAGFV